MQHLLIILNIVNFISNRIKFNAQNHQQCILNNILQKYVADFTDLLVLKEVYII